jgi:hypothetical protein
MCSQTATEALSLGDSVSGEIYPHKEALSSVGDGWLRGYSLCRFVVLVRSDNDLYSECSRYSLPLPPSVFTATVQPFNFSGFGRSTRFSGKGSPNTKR